MKRQSGGILLLTTFTILLLVYRLENNLLNLLTGVLLILALFLFCWSLCIAIFALLKISERNESNIKIFLTSSLISLLLLEGFLRFGSGKYETYMERNGLAYRSIYQSYNTGRYHLYPSNYELSYSKKEFEYHRKTNSMGLCEMEFDIQKMKGDFTILGLGDSFMEGVGTSYDSTWLKSLEFYLTKRKHKKITTINAGISGSDIIYQWVLFKEKLIRLSPDLVIFEINTSDITDVIVRGGMERFVGDSTVSFKDPPFFESFYVVSYVFRHVLHDLFNYSFLLIPTNEMEVKQLNAINLINQVLVEIKQYTDKRGIKFLLILNPWEIDVKNKSFSVGNFHEITKGIESNSFDLLQYYLSTNSIHEENSYEYYWEIDLHYKPKGYWQMGEAIGNEIEERYLE